MAVKTKTNTWYRKKAVEVAKLIAKHLGNYVCCRCGKSAASGYQMHGSHILPESKFHRMSCVVSNIMCQCARCHMDWHEHPLAQREWFDEKFPGRYDKLKKMDEEFSKEYIKPDYKKIWENLKKQYNLIING